MANIEEEHARWLWLRTNPKQGVDSEFRPAIRADSNVDFSGTATPGKAETEAMVDRAISDFFLENDMVDVGCGWSKLEMLCF
jgi:hypothetical protein